MNKNENKMKNKERESKISLEDMYSYKSSQNEEEKEENSNEENINLDEDEKEIEINENLLNISINTPKEEIIEFEIESIETISIKKFRLLLGVLGIKTNNFIIERLYQTLIRVSSKKYEHISSNLTDKNFINYINILNNSKIHNEIFYTFFDISNKGFITKNDFINVADNMIQTICEFTHKNYNIYKDNIIKYYENKIIGNNNYQQNLSKDILMNKIENNEINFYDIMNYNEYKYFEKDKKDELYKNILLSIKYLKNIIKQKEDIETNLTIVTDNYLDNVDIIKDEKQQSENSINLSNVSSFIDNNKNNNNKFDILNSNASSNQKIEKSNESISLNTNKTSFLICPKIINDIKIKSPQERLSNKPNFSDDEIDEISSESNSLYSKEEDDINYDFVKEINDINIKDIKNKKKNKLKIISKNINIKENINEAQKKKFFFLKPFRQKDNKILEDELKKNYIDINDSLILLKKNNFLNYLENLDNQLKENKINNEKEISNIEKDILSNKIILNKPLKDKEQFDNGNYFKDLNNKNIELLLAITLGIEKCISSLGDYDLLDKNIINDIIGQEINTKTTRKNRNSLFPTKIEKKDNNINNKLLELISNYPFKKNEYSFEEKNNFNYSFYTIAKNEEISINKAEIIEYAPEIFCNIRYTLGEINNKNFIKSFNIENLISNIFLGKINNLNELLTINNNNYPEFIMFSPDTKYIVKCINYNEFEVFQKILPNYYNYLMNNTYKNIQKNNLENVNSILNSTLCSSSNNLNLETKNTFLEIIYGLYSISLLDKNIYFIIKKNIFYSSNNLKISKRYDLKGCSIDRKSKSKNSYLFKDLDFIDNSEKLNISSKISNYIYNILEKDTSFLAQNNIINYSFYLGIAEIPENFEPENDEGIISSDKNLMYYFGINDIFTEYGKGKVVEHIFKKITKGDSISAVPPDDYKIRFDNFIKICLK